MSSGLNLLSKKRTECTFGLDKMENVHDYDDGGSTGVMEMKGSLKCIIKSGR